MPPDLPDKLKEQIAGAALPTSGEVPFIPALRQNRKGDLIIDKATIKYGPKKGKRGYLDTEGRIWLRDYAHSGYPDHWDVQIDDGKDYQRVDLNGDPL